MQRRKRRDRHAERKEKRSGQRPEHVQKSHGKKEVAYHMIISRHNHLCLFLFHISFL